MLNLEPYKQRRTEFQRYGADTPQHATVFDSQTRKWVRMPHQPVTREQIVGDLDDLLAEVERLREAWNMRVGATTS